MLKTIFVIKSRNHFLDFFIMPLQLLDYSIIRDKSKAPIWEQKYVEFGNKVI